VTKRQVSQAILRTLAYAAVFDAGLKKKQLFEHLITPQPISWSRLTTEIEDLLIRHKIIEVSGFFFLSGKQNTLMSSRWKESNRKKRFLLSRIHLIAWIPTVRAIAITGSVGAGNAKVNQDIDLFVVTAPKTVWLSRLLVELIVFFSGQLRTRDSHEMKDFWCLNMWCDGEHLMMSKKNLYIAHEIIQADWVLDKDSIQESFIGLNPWIREYMANHHMIESSPSSHVWWSSLFTPLDVVAFGLQRLYMYHRTTREVIARGHAFFHPRNTTKIVLKEYEKILGAYKISS
jgi:hypothetical protein